MEARPRAARGWLLSGGLLAWSACVSTGPSYGTVSGTHSAASHGAVAATGGGASSTTGATATGSTGGSTSGTSTSGAACPPVTMLDESLGDCGDGGLVELRAQLEDALADEPLQIPVQFTDLSHPGSVAQSNACGQIVYCVSPGTKISPYVQSPASYESAIFDDLLINISKYYEDFPLFQTAILGSALAAVSPAFDPNQGAVAIKVTRAFSGLACSQAGWSFSALGPDGGPLSAIQADSSGTSLEPGSSTADDGIACLYNIDASITEVTIVGFQDGGSCAYDGQVDQYLPTVRLQPGVISMVAFEISASDGG